MVTRAYKEAWIKWEHGEDFRMEGLGKHTHTLIYGEFRGTHGAVAKETTDITLPVTNTSQEHRMFLFLHSDAPPVVEKAPVYTHTPTTSNF